MSNSKISGLAAATTPLAGTETLPVVQGGVTKQVSVANLTLGRAVGSAGGTFTDNMVQGPAGKGLNLSANTPAAGMTSQLLNWYEEGTWTPTDDGVSSGVIGTWAFVAGSGKYTRVGRVVTVEAAFSGAAIGLTAATGYYRWSGLPFNQVGILLGKWASGDIVYLPIVGNVIGGGTNKFWINASQSSTPCTSIVLQLTYTV